jgi:hypothetical protein
MAKTAAAPKAVDTPTEKPSKHLCIGTPAGPCSGGRSTRPAKGATVDSGRCYQCWATMARADKVAKPVAVLVAVKAAPKARKPSQNPRVLANRMVTARAKAIAARANAEA